jgi:hypothetical protein
MSVSNFKRSFTNPLLRRLEKERRTKIETQKGQVLVLGDVNAFVQVIEESFGISVSPEQASQAYEAGHKKALELHNRFKRNKRFRRRYNAIVAALPHLLGPREFVLEENLFIVESFGSSIGTVKQAILNEFVTAGTLTEIEKAQVQSKVHKGHGVFGEPVSRIDIAATISGAQRKTNLELLRENLGAYMKAGHISNLRAREIDNLFTRYESRVTMEGNLRASYVSIVTYQVGSENTGVDAAEERAVKQAFRAFIKEISPDVLNWKGSKSLKDKVEYVLVDKSSRGIKKHKGVKTTKSKNPKIDLTTSGQVRVTGQKENPSVSLKTQGKIATRAKRGPSSAPLQLMVYLNKRLSDVVAKNMVYPQLVYRTGRFADSVIVVDVQQTPKGYPSFGYTYQRNPYQVFEMGIGRAPWATPERDPRKIINQSIREIAAEVAIGRFYTRRV